jgi:hypothetical protein
MTRREILATMSALAAPVEATENPAEAKAPAAQPEPVIQVDFRYSPLDWQTAYCFPDDPHKSLVDQAGRLLYGNPGRRSQDFYPTIVEFSLRGMERDHVVGQELEGPGVPIVHTVVERPRARVELISFATSRAGEGRVDNLLLRLSARVGNRTELGPAGRAVPLVRIRTREALERTNKSVFLSGDPKTQLLVCSRGFNIDDHGSSWQLALPALELPAEILLRFPQEGQTVGTADGAALLEEARAYWKNWHPFGGAVEWELPGPYADFLTACARNILQAREVRNGHLTFQVGPTCYRGLWVVDGNFILEAARYLGYDREARAGLQTTWTYQRADGALDAGGGPEHYKDSAIAMFSTVRQCELGQDWSDFRALQPRIAHAAGFLESMRDKGRAEGSPAGQYGLLALGFSDGGFTKGNEFTNPLWSLAGLQAATQADGGAPANGLERAAKFYAELRAAFETAARQEMLRHPAGFDYLPMVMREDPAWQREEWERPRPQTAQWALSHAIYPGLVFAPNHPVVRGHIALMQWCTKEDVPAETGWLPHEGLWTYNAPFVAHAYLWAGERAWARRAFHGFLNHASPLYCWREEQPLRGSTVAGYVGDMPHNWASAECVLYLRHMLALEDGPALRLLEGVGATELAGRQPWRLHQTPTRFGRVNLELTPQGAGWRLKFERGTGPAPRAVRLPAALAGQKFVGVKGAAARPGALGIEVEPSAGAWTAEWGA